MLRPSGIQTTLEEGFTLVELLVTIVLFSIVMLTVFSSFNAFTSSGALIRTALENDSQMRIAADRIRADLETIVINRLPKYHAPDIDDEPDRSRFYGTREAVSGSRFSRLEFSSLSHIGPKDTLPKGIGEIVYYVRKHPSGRLDLCRFDRPAGTNGIPDPCRDPLLAKQITAFDLNFLDGNGDKTNEWDSDSSRFDYIFPAAVQITIGFEQNDGHITYIETAVALPVNRRPIDPTR